MVPGSANLAAIVTILILKPIGGISLWFALLKGVLLGSDSGMAY